MSCRGGTRLADRAGVIPDDVFDEAAGHFGGRALGALVATIASISTWNRLNVLSRQVAGEWTAQWANWPAGRPGRPGRPVQVALFAKTVPPPCARIRS
jgi:hypothetical protein